MNNVHSRSFKETYKPKLRIEVKKENEEVLDESDANLGVFDYDVFPIDVDLDELLSNFVKSDFDVNILKTWDKIKKI